VTSRYLEKKEDEWWVGWIEEVPGVNCQEITFQELKESLEVTLKEALEFNRQDALSAAGTGYTEEKIATSRMSIIRNNLGRPCALQLYDSI
jgi:predicted RNase H-like HicB family nuclease